MEKSFCFFFQKEALPFLLVRMTRFDIIDPSFASLVLPNAPLLTLGEHYAWLEGPVWFADANHLLVSDLPNDRILRWTEPGGVSVFREPSGFANGHTRDREGRLIGCSHRHRCITRTELDGTITTLASHYQGKRLNAPNDVTVHSDGGIWFTDPHYGINTDYEGGKQHAELPATVYRLDPATGALAIVADDFAGPNGICFSPDETLLYIAETGSQFAADPARHIRAFTVENATRLTNPRIFHTVSPGYADGFRCDEDGRLWSSAADGVHCIAPDGSLLGKILTPDRVSNLVFGGRNRSRLFLCVSHTLMAIYTNVRGAQRP
jgi:gluconolactonase